MRRVVAAAVTMSMLTMLSGCAAMRDDRPLCIGVFSGTGALLGATAGGLISGVAASHGDESPGSTNWEIGLSTGGGAIVGGLIGWGLSNWYCEEPPPPPPPPAPVRTPPPPPPTERRGG
jgi:MFS family permease